jgi:predicted nucleic acid-binding Zn ribbon protein
MLIFDVKIKPTWFSRGYDMRLYALPKMTGLPPTCLVCGRQFPEDNHDDLWGENWGSRIDADARGSFMGQVDDSGTGTVAGWDCRYPLHQPSWDGNPGGFCQILLAFLCHEYVGRDFPENSVALLVHSNRASQQEGRTPMVQMHLVVIFIYVKEWLAWQLMTYILIVHNHP